MTLGEIFVSSFLVGFSGAMVPGPVLSVTITETTKRGFWAGPLIVLGHGIVELAWVVSLSVGISHLTDLYTTFVSVAGGLFLLWMGAAMTLSVIRGSVSLDLSQRGGKGHLLGPILLGGGTSASNPYWHLWWITVGAAYIARAQGSGLGGTGNVAFFTGHILSDLLWYCLISFAVALGKSFLNDYIYKALFLICGVFLVGIGVSFVWYGCIT